jgi:hypothetical protein
LKTADYSHPAEGERSPIDWVLQDLGKRTCL